MDTEKKVRNPIKVFISSGCGEGKERYNKVRADLKARIEETKMATVFLFEDSRYASTLSASQFYLREIDDSDLCIFLIDNADGVFDGVAPEIQRARALEKKSIYIFCTQDSKELTWAQKQLEGPKGEKYYEVSSFDLIPEIGYESLINDIVRIYHYYCEKWLIDFEQNIPQGKLIEIANDREAVKESLISNIDRTKVYLSKSIYDNHREIIQTSLLDEYCEAFLKVVLGDNTINQFNTYLLLVELKKTQSQDYFTIVQLRWKAVTAFFAGDLDECIAELKDARNEAEKLHAASWVQSDILIDLRNVSDLVAESNGQIIIENEYQKALNNSDEILFYPVLDRLISNFYEGIDKSRIEETLKSPYTFTFGNDIDRISDNIASAFVVAVFNGSLTQINIIHKRLRSMAMYLCEKYDDWCFRILALKFTALSSTRSEMADAIQAFNEILGKMNANDAISIYDMMDCIPIQTKKFTAKLMVFENLGYYFSDEDYSTVCKQIYSYIKEWLNSNDPNIFLGENIFKALQENIYRADNNKIIDICLSTLTFKTRRFWGSALKLISKMGTEFTDKEYTLQIVERVLELIKCKDDRNNINSLDAAIITLRKTAVGFEEKIDGCIEEYWPEFYTGIYSLEIYGDDEDVGLSQIEKYLLDIDSENKTQGVNGAYSLYSISPYKVIGNIIKENPFSINAELSNRIISILGETIMCERQTPRAKMDAFYLAAILRILFPETKYACDRLNEKVMQLSNILVRKRLSLEHISEFNITWAYTLFKLSNRIAKPEDVLDLCCKISDAGDAEKIEALGLLADYLEFEDISDLDLSIIFILLSICLNCYSSKNHAVRYHSISAMLYMITPETFDVVYRQLLLAMDFDSIQIKRNILSHLEKLQCIDANAAIGISQKAKSDTNYIIRKFCAENDM